MWRIHPRKLLTLVRALPRPKICGNCLGEVPKNEAEGAADSSPTSHWPRRDPIFIAPSWSHAPPGLSLPIGAGPDNWRNELLYRGGDIERHPGPKKAIPLRGRDVLMQDVLPTAAQHRDVAVSELEKHLRVREIHGPEKLVSNDLNDTRNAG